MYMRKIEDTWANKWGSFPTMGGTRCYEQEEHKAVMLIAMADGMRSGCPEGVEDCEACAAIASVWWEECNALDRRVRVRMQWVMAELGIPLPDLWEAVLTNAVSDSRN